MPSFHETSLLLVDFIKVLLKHCNGVSGKTTEKFPKDSVLGFKQMFATDKSPIQTKADSLVRENR